MFSVLGFGLWVLGCRALGFGFRAVRVEGLGFRILGSGLRV